MPFEIDLCIHLLGIGSVYGLYCKDDRCSIICGVIFHLKISNLTQKDKSNLTNPHLSRNLQYSCTIRSRGSCLVDFIINFFFSKCKFSGRRIQLYILQVSLVKIFSSCRYSHPILFQKNGRIRRQC